MESLPQALQRLTKLYEEKKQKSVLSPTPLRGLTSEDGKPLPTMEALPLEAQIAAAGPRPLSAVVAQAITNTNALNGLSSRRPSTADTLLRDDAAGQGKLAAMLFQCFNTLKTYGKDPEQMRDTVALFQQVLGRFTTSQVALAFSKYLERNSEMPAPADIVNIIEPPRESLSAATYVSLQKKAYAGEYLLSSEREFCEAFRKQEYAKMRGGSEDYHEALREVKQFQIAYDNEDA